MRQQKVWVLLSWNHCWAGLVYPPRDILEIFEEFDNKRTPADWALQWLWNQPEVSLVLSGMGSMEQVKENIQSASASGINTLDAGEIQLIERVREKYLEKTAISCTGCQYCMLCPNSVDIPKNFKIYNDASIYSDLNGSRRGYINFLAEDKRASSCTQCQLCEEKCPQTIPISQWMPKVHEVLGEGKKK